MISDCAYRQARRRERLRIGARPLLDDPETRGSGHVDDPLASPGDEMFDGLQRALPVVGHQRHGVVGSCGQRVDDRDGKMREIDGQRFVDAFSGGDDAVDLLVQQGIDMDLGEVGIVLDGA